MPKWKCITSQQSFKVLTSPMSNAGHGLWWSESPVPTNTIAGHDPMPDAAAKSVPTGLVLYIGETVPHCFSNNMIQADVIPLLTLESLICLPGWTFRMKRELHALLLLTVSHYICYLSPARAANFPVPIDLNF